MGYQRLQERRWQYKGLNPIAHVFPVPAAHAQGGLIPYPPGQGERYPAVRKHKCHKTRLKKTGLTRDVNPQEPPTIARLRSLVSVRLPVFVPFAPVYFNIGQCAGVPDAKFMITCSEGLIWVNG